MAVKGTVLIGFGEAFAAIEAAWSLQDEGFRVVAFSRGGGRPAVRRVRGIEVRELTAPERDVAATREQLLALIAAVEPVAYLPLDDAAVLLTRGLEDHVRVAGPTGRGIDYALDKQLQLEAAREAGLPVPPTQVVQRIHDLDTRAYPLMVKPARALYESDGRLVRPTGVVCADDAEFERATAREWYPPLLVQPLIRGVGEGLFGHAGERGVVGWSSHRRIRMVNPQGSASSACASQPVDPALVEPAERLLTAIGWRGLFMLEFLRDEQGRPWFMELNGRAWGSMSLARRRGFDYPAWTVRAALDEAYVPALPADRPEIVCRHLGRELAHAAFVARGAPSGALDAWPRLWPTIRALARMSRRDRLYNWKRSQPEVLLADTMATLGLYARRAVGSQR
jgi:predicted ATP-grasp superfamily ATP-dependent carboligase